MTLDDVKLILHIEHTDSDSLLNLLISNAETTIINYLNLETFPAELSHIVVEVVVERFNLLGAEGLASENIQSNSMTFKKSAFQEFLWELDAYAKNNDLTNNNRRFYMR